MKMNVRRVAAQLLCIVMVLSVVMPFASADYGDSADRYYRYNTLDEIPENVDIFRPIRAGSYRGITIDGESFIEFRMAGYPTVMIKKSAFGIFPNNSYLNADNTALTQNCKNTGKGEEPGGASRVCYYKKMTTWKQDVTLDLDYDGFYDTVSCYMYTFSMYRLELAANAEDCNEVYIDAKLTSAVTFDYNDTLGSLSRRSPSEVEPLRPSVSVILTDHPDDVRLRSCKVLESIGVYSPQLSASEITNVGMNAVFCVGSIVAACEAPSGETIKEAVKDCTPLVISAVDYSLKKGHYSGGDAGNHNPAKYPYKEVLVSPVKLKSSNDYVSIMYSLINCRDLGSVNYLVSFSFT